MDKGKNKVPTKLGKIPGSIFRIPAYKAAVEKTDKQVREEALKAVPKEEQLREDAYELAVKTVNPKEYVYPYIPIKTIWIAPIERKYSHLSAEEVTNFYLKNFTDPFLYPKDFQFYQDILAVTGSVQFDSTIRTGQEWAFSKALIMRVIKPEEWDGDLFKIKEIAPKNPKYKYMFSFHYFDYVKAWDMAFCYENRQKKHSWFIQFKGPDFSMVPNWFLVWFSNWGLYPIILPNKIRGVYEDFVKTNPSMKAPGFMFAALYQVPWIARWDAVIENRNFQNFGMRFSNIPYLGRRIMIKWWNKFEFFKDSIFATRGIINLEPPKLVHIKEKKETAELLKELLASSSKKDLKKQLKAILDSSSEDEEDEDLMSQDSVAGSNDLMQDAQDPNQ